MLYICAANRNTYFKYKNFSDTDTDRMTPIIETNTLKRKNIHAKTRTSIDCKLCENGDYQALLSIMSKASISRKIPIKNQQKTYCAMKYYRKTKPGEKIYKIGCDAESEKCAEQKSANCNIVFSNRSRSIRQFSNI